MNIRHIETHDAATEAPTPIERANALVSARHPRQQSLDLEPGVFTWKDPFAIAQSLKASAEASQRRKSTPFQSAMSMLTFYINRAGNQLTAEQRACLEAAKDELRVLFDQPRHAPPTFIKPRK